MTNRKKYIHPQIHPQIHPKKGKKHPKSCKNLYFRYCKRYIIPCGVNKIKENSIPCANLMANTEYSYRKDPHGEI
tara:strand:- start:211 stop:435 length:225 start_codon:yes stop_codon:yes gene_type:complete